MRTAIAILRHNRHPSVMIAAAFLLGLSGQVKAEDWPQWLGPQRDGVWRETGILDKFPKNGPKLRWRADLGGGYAGPAVANGRVFVMDRLLQKGAKNPDNPFAKDKVAGEERVLCFDDKDGKEIWRHTYPCQYSISYPGGPRTTPVVHDGKVYTLGAMGDLYCLNEKDGKVIWSKSFSEAYMAPVPTWGFAAHPVIEGDKLICLVGGPGSVVVAFDKNTGDEKWKALSLRNAELGYCPPTVINVGGKRQLIIWHPESVNSLDPETGTLYWSEKFQSQSNMSISPPRLDGDRLLISGFYNGSLMLKLDKNKPAETVLWKSKGTGETPTKTDTLHSVMSPPYMKDGYIYGVCSYGELRCLKEEDGSRVWEDLRATGKMTKPTERWGNAFLTPQGDRWFLFNEKGDLIIAKLSPKGYEEIDRAHLLEPTSQLPALGGSRKVVWSHPAYANKSIYVRNDKEIVCYSLAAE